MKQLHNNGLTNFAGFTTLVFFVANGFVGASFCSVVVVCFELTAADLAFLNPRGADTLKEITFWL